MNKLTTSANIFNDSAVAIDYLTSGQAPQRGHIDRAKFLQLKITGEDNEDQFEEFLERYLQPYAFLYTYQFDGKDDLVFTTYIGEAVFAEVEGVISDTMGRIGPFEKRTANAKEVDEIVRLFFSSGSLA